MEIFTDHLAVGHHYTRGYQSSCKKENVRQEVELLNLSTQAIAIGLD